MILLLLRNLTKASEPVLSAQSLATALKKDLALCMFADGKENENICKDLILSFLEEKNMKNTEILIKSDTDSLLEVCEELEASFLFVQLENNKAKNIKYDLKQCRELRIPYLLWMPFFSPLQSSKVLVPVGFLEEEIEKAQFASAFGRFCKSEITVLQANDYGSKAKRTVEKMLALFEKFNLNYLVEKAQKDSYKFEKEAVLKAEKENFDIIIISASREYGLDDIIFGSKELHLVKQSNVPILLVNPRGDLYALCD